MLQVSGNTLQQMAKFKYGGVIFARDGRWSEEIDARTGKANAVLREFLYRFSVSVSLSLCGHKTGAFKHRKAVCFQISLCSYPYLLYSHESWVMTEKLSQVQAAEMGFLRRVHGTTQGRTEVRWRPGRETSLAPHVQFKALFVNVLH